MRRVFFGVLSCVMALSPLTLSTQSTIRVMLLDGQNNHRWAETSPVIKPGAGTIIS